MRRVLNAGLIVSAFVGTFLLGMWWARTLNRIEAAKHREAFMEFDSMNDTYLGHGDFSAVLDVLESPAFSESKWASVSLRGGVPGSQLSRLRKSPIKELSMPASWLYDVFEEPAFPQLQTLYVSPSPTGPDLSIFGNGPVFPSVQVLGLPKAIGTGSGLKSIVERFPNVRWVNLSDSDLDDQSCGELSRWKNLEHLHLTGSRVTANALTELRECTNLQTVWVQRTGVQTEEIPDDLPFEVRVN